MFINAPMLSDDIPEEEQEAILSRIVFTEIDHNYVNPTTSKYPWVAELMKPLEKWNSVNSYYSNPMLTFNEYMTWALFTLYMYDNFDQEVFNKRNEVETNFMIKRRGFIRFKEFNNYLLNWYMKSEENGSESMYNAIYEWLNS